MTRPVIGVLLDERLAPSAGSDFSRRPYLALRFDYFDWINAQGGTPIALPYAEGREEEFCALCDGVLLPGSEYRFRKDWYVDGGASVPDTESRRRAYEESLTRAIDAANIPVLGVCGGMQVMACVRGAKLTPDLRKTDTDIQHWSADGIVPEHACEIVEGSALAGLIGAGMRTINSAHSEAVIQPPETVRVSGIAPDGVIEAVEWPDRDYAIGVQWHPELRTGSDDVAGALMQALIEAAKARRAAR